MVRRAAVLVVLAALLAACSRGTPEEAASPGDEQPAAQPATATDDRAADDAASAAPHEAGAPSTRAKPIRLVDPSVSLALLGAPFWFDFAHALADKTYLIDAFARAGFTVPEGSYIYAARVVPGADQPALIQYSWGESGFVSSKDIYWPASAVKLMAAIGALLSLGEFDLDGTATLRWTDPYGEFEGTARDLIAEAIVPSDNPAYNRLMLLSGLDAFHRKHFRADDAFPQLIQQRFYVKPDPSANFVVSPEIAWTTTKGETGTIPERVAKGDYTDCPEEGNCVSLFELTEVLRRVTLDQELPQRHQFDLTDADHAFLIEKLDETKCKYDQAVADVLGVPVDQLVDLNKAGRVRGDDHLDHVLFIEPSGRRWFLAISVPYVEPGEADSVTEAKLDQVARATMTALLEQPRDAWPTPLQWPAVSASAPTDWQPTLALHGRQDQPGTQLAWSDPVSGFQLAVYRGAARLGVLARSEDTLLAELAVGDTLITVLEPTDGGDPVGYRAFAVQPR